MTDRSVLCVRNEAADTCGLAPEVLEDEQLTVALLDAYDPAARWPALDAIEALLVFGGAMNVDQTDRFPYLARVRDLMAGAVQRGAPVLGICLGAQLLARALGARVHRMPKPEFGFEPLSPTPAGIRDDLIGTLAPGDRVFEWHEDTFDLPTEAVLLATSPSGVAQAFRVGPRAWALQFHIEVTFDELDTWLESGGPSLEKAWGKPADAIRQQARRYLPIQQERARRLFRGVARSIAPVPR